MGDKRNSDRDEVTGAADERLRGIADDEDFDDAEELVDDETDEEDEESSTF